MLEPVDPLRQMPARNCDLCAEQMKHIGNVPRTAKAAEIRVFRCYVSSRPRHLIQSRVLGPATNFLATGDLPRTLNDGNSKN